MKSRSLLTALPLLMVPSLAYGQELFDAAVQLGPSLFTNYIQLADLDGDGDLDILSPNCGGFIGTQPLPFEAYRNGGAGNFSDYGFPLGTNKCVRMVAIGDIDGDSDLDVYVPDGAAGPHLMFVNNGSGVFADESANRLPAGFSSRAGATEFADVDNDGDLDLFVGDAYAANGATVGRLLLNDGSGNFTEGPAMPASAGGADPIDVDFADVDRDWDLDVVVNMHVGKSLLWLNDGAGTFSDATTNVHAMEGFHYGPSLCDTDGDGDLDMWTDNAGPGLNDTLATNDGGVFTDMSSTLVADNGNFDDNGVICVDIDHDGDLDASIPSLSGRERVLYNNGGVFSSQGQKFPASADDNTLWLDFGDLNGDGRLDAVTALGEPPGPNKVFLANANMPVDTQAPRIIMVEQPTLVADQAGAIRFAVSDSVVTDTGPRLDRAYVRMDAPDVQEIAAAFAGGDHFRAPISGYADGTVVTYAACAVDLQGNQACSEALSVTVGQGGGAGGMGAGGMGVGGVPSGGAGSGAGSVGGSGNDGGDDFTVEDDDGCGCAVLGQRSAPTGGLALLLGLGLLVSRRRRDQ